jgi:flagellar motor switch protein FliM
MNSSTVTNVSQGDMRFRERTILPCNFRSAGRLSNDSTRHLRTMHETFARSLSHSLDLFLGSPLDVKLLHVEQIDSRQFTASLSNGNYLVPFAVLPMQGRIIAKFDSSLLFPLLDVLLGGTGHPHEHVRELTDIDEELIRSVTELIGVQLERAWKACKVAVTPTPSIKPALVGQIFATEERVLLLHFEITLGTTTGAFEIIVPMAFSNALVRTSQTEATRRVASQAAPMSRLRDRLLDCTMLVSTDLTGLHVSVGDLVELRPGGVLNFRAAVQTPVRLFVGDRPLFDVTPVRRGRRKAAQLGRAYQQEIGE